MGALDTWLRVAIALVPVGLFFWLSFRAPRKRRAAAEAVPDDPPDEPYHVYTRAYDLELPAQEAIGRLVAASPDARKGHLKGEAEWDSALNDLAYLIDVQDLLDEADPGETSARLQAAAGAIKPADLVVALLIDQSGSMKGEPIASAAKTALFLAERLHDFGARSEVFGFTTAGWHGGWAREQWIDDGKPLRPGRLCALLHIIYKSADEPAMSAEASRIMVHPDLLRENVDGEAIIWARERLAARPERHKLLIVISDGAPVDDSTLAANGPDFLYRHLMAVIRETEADERLVIGGVGLGHDVEACYWLARTAKTPLHLWTATTELLGMMLASANESAAAASQSG